MVEAQAKVSGKARKDSVDWLDNFIPFCATSFSSLSSCNTDHLDLMFNTSVGTRCTHPDSLPASRLYYVPMHAMLSRRVHTL